MVDQIGFRGNLPQYLEKWGKGVRVGKDFTHKADGKVLKLDPNSKRGKSFIESKDNNYTKDTEFSPVEMVKAYISPTVLKGGSFREMVRGLFKREPDIRLFLETKAKPNRRVSLTGDHPNKHHPYMGENPFAMFNVVDKK